MCVVIGWGNISLVLVLGYLVEKCSKRGFDLTWKLCFSNAFSTFGLLGN